VNVLFHGGHLLQDRVGGICQKESTKALVRDRQSQAKQLESPYYAIQKTRQLLTERHGHRTVAIGVVGQFVVASKSLRHGRNCGVRPKELLVRLLELGRSFRALGYQLQGGILGRSLKGLKQRPEDSRRGREQMMCGM